MSIFFSIRKRSVNAKFQKNDTILVDWCHLSKMVQLICPIFITVSELQQHFAKKTEKKRESRVVGLLYKYKILEVLLH